MKKYLGRCGIGCLEPVTTDGREPVTCSAHGLFMRLVEDKE